MPRVLFEKTGNAVWISHLDLMRVFQRAFKRGGIAIGFSQGYSPRAYVSIALPLSVGQESVCEILDFDLDESNTAPLAEIPERLNRTLPAGVRVKEVWETGRKMKELTHLDAEITMEYDDGISDLSIQRIQALFASKDQPLVMEKKTKSGGINSFDIKEMILSCQVERMSQEEVLIKARVCAQNPSLNPMMLPEALKVYAPELAPSFTKVRRAEVLDSNGTPFR